MDINLLPWREEIIAYNKKVLMKLMAGALSIVAIVILMTYFLFFSSVSYTRNYIRALEESKTHLLQKITVFLNQKKMEEKISQRVSTLNRLQQSRFETLRLFNEIARVTPKGMYLSKMERKNNQVEIQGVTNSNLLITQYMKDIDASPEFDVVSLQKVEKTEGKNLVVTEFDLFLALTMIPDEAISQDKESKTEMNNPVKEILKMRENKEKNEQEILKK